MDFGDLRNLKEFLALYNKISEKCFQKCILNMSQSKLDDEESECVSTCTQKHINVNHKTVLLYADINPGFQERKVKENEAELRRIKEEHEKAIEESLKPPTGIMKYVPNWVYQKPVPMLHPALANLPLSPEASVPESEQQPPQ